MVWSAATFWAETSEGSTQQKWAQTLQLHNATSSVSPQRHLRRLLRRGTPNERFTSVSVSPVPHPMTSAAACSAAALEVKNVEAAKPVVAASSPTPLRSNPLTAMPRRLPPLDTAVPAMSPILRPSSTADGTQLRPQQPPVFVTQEARLDDTLAAPSANFDLSRGELAASNSDGDSADQYLTGEERVEGDEIHIGAPKKDFGTIDKECAMRVKQLRRQRKAELVARGVALATHIAVVKHRCDAQQKAKEEHTKEVIVAKARRFLDPIDRCTTLEESHALRAQSFNVIIPHALLILFVDRAIRREKAVRKLQFIFRPVLRLWRRRRWRTIITFAGRWLFKNTRPSVDMLQEMLTPLALWPAKSVEHFMRSFRPKRYHAGEVIAFEGEPGTAAFVLMKGKVSLRQGKGKSLKELGQRAAPAMLNEEAVTKKYRTTSVVKLLCLEDCITWDVSRAVFQREAMMLPASHALEGGHGRGGERSKPAGDGAEGDDDVMLIALQARQVRECRVYNFWDQEPLQALLDQCTHQKYHRGAVIYKADDHPTFAFIVWKGTVEVTPCLTMTPVAATLDDHLQLGSSHQLNASTSGGGLPRVTSTMSQDHGPLSTTASHHSLKKAGSRTKLVKNSGLNATASIYLNAGQSFGEEAIIFNCVREGTATAATDLWVYEVPPAAFIDGCFMYPEPFYQYRVHLNRLRANRLVRPPLSSFVTLQVNPQVQSAIHRLMTPVVVCKGEMLPLASSVVLLARGHIVMDGKQIHAPSFIVHAQAFSAALALMENEVAKEQASQSGGNPAALTTAPNAGGVLSGSFIGTKDATQATSPEQVSAFSQQLEDALTVSHKATTRVDAWCLDFDTLLHRCRGITKLTDVVGIPAKETTRSKRHQPPQPAGSTGKSTSK